MPTIEKCPKCGSDDIYKCRSIKEPNGDCFQCGGCNVVLPNSELKKVKISAHVTTYDELGDALKECREELEAFLNDEVCDYKDTEKLLLKLDILYGGLKPRKRRK